MNRWPTRPLEDLVRDRQISYGVVQPGQDSAQGIPIVRVKDVRNGVIDTSNPMRVDQEIASRHGRTTLDGGELLLSLVGTVGESAVAPASIKGWNVARAIAVLRPEGVSPRWLQLCFESPTVQTMVDSLLNTTVQATLNLSDLKRIQIPVPPAPVREGIEQVVGALDDKIAANTKLASTADEWVRAEYDRMANLSNEKRTIADLVTHRRNAADPAVFKVHVPYVGLEHIPRRSMWLEAHGTSDEVSSNKSHFQSGDILFGKLRPYFHKVVTAPKSGICSTDILVLASTDGTLSGYALASLAHDSVVQAVTAASEGTRMPRTSWKDLSNVEVPWPGQTAAAAFSTKVQTIRSSVIGVLSENQTLAATREALLPQLMSGKLHVKEAAEVVAAAI